MKTFCIYPYFTGRLPALWWSVALIFLVTQGVASAATPPCALDEIPTELNVLVPGMTDAAMPMSAVSSTADGCQHCHSHRLSEGHGCVGQQGCTAQLAAPLPLLLFVRHVGAPAVLLPASIPRATSVAFAPPLRPPAA